MILRAAGLETVPIPTDGGGPRVDDLARQVGIACRYHATEHYTEHGLVLGYGNLADGAVDEAVRQLSAAIRDCW